MAMRNLIKFGLPLSFVYCTIYQQDIWREGDERAVAQLVEEQKRSFSKLFSLINNNTKLVIPKFSVECWNNKVQSAFQLASDPAKLACKLYRKFQPYLTQTTPTDNKKTGSIETN